MAIGDVWLEWNMGERGKIKRKNKKLRDGGMERERKWDPPRLNMAIPRPASDSMEMDLAIIFGIVMCHLAPFQLINK